MTAELRLERIKPRWVDRYRKYVVEIDGDEVGEIEGDFVLTYAIDPGSHQIRLTLDDILESETIAFDVDAGDTKRFACGPKRRKTNDWLWIFNFSSTIHLREVD